MKLTKTFVLTEIGDAFMAVPVGDNSEDSRYVVRLNETAVDIWHGIEQEKTVEQIAAELVEKYDGVELAEAAGYVRNTVNELIKSGIVEE